VQRPVSVSEAAAILGISEQAVLKRIHRGTLLAHPFSARGWMVCAEALFGQSEESFSPVSENAFRRLCRDYISVTEACDIVCVTDGMVCRMLADGRLEGFRLNRKTWAVSRKSCVENMRQYLASPFGRGRPRRPARGSRRQGRKSGPKRG
jgi:hypothetical protein